MLFTATDGLGRTGSTATRVFATGPAPGLMLTVINGDLTINDAWVAAHGQTLDRYWIKGHLIFTASVPFWVTRSIIQGRSFPTPGQPPRTSIVYARSSSTPATALLHLTDTEVFAVQPDVNLVTASGERLGLLVRCNLHHGSDLVNYWGPPVQMIDCWVHDFTYWPHDPKHDDGPSHNDGVQSNGCTDGYVLGCLFDMRAAPGGFQPPHPNGAWGSAIMLTGSVTLIEKMRVQGNVIGYGQTPVAMPRQVGGPNENGQNSWDVSGNTFWALPDPYGVSDHQMVRWGWGKGPSPATVHDNTFTSHPPIPLPRRGSTLPPAVLVGGATVSGQYIVRVA